jgi:hypothetical protein
VILKMSIGERRGGVERIREGLRSLTLNSVRAVLPDKAIHEACRLAGHEYRDRLLGPVVMVLHMVMAGLWAEKSFGASWQMIWKQLASVLPEASGESPGSGSVSKARDRLPLKVWEQLFGWLSNRIQEESGATDLWRGLRLLLVDGTVVSMPDRPALFAAFGRVRGKHRPYYYPLARVVVLVLANSMGAIAYAMGAYRDSEVFLLQGLLGHLRPGDLLIGDRSFAGTNRYAQFLAHGAHFITRLHQRRKLERLPRLNSYGVDDFVTELKVAALHRKADPSLPEKVTVRVIRVEARIRGKHRVFWLATSLLDGRAYPAHEIAELYCRRWRQETFFRNLKTSLGSDVLRSRTPDGVRCEMAARLVASNVVRSIMLAAAKTHRVAPERLSFAGAIRSILSFAPAMAAQPVSRLPAVYSAMLREIAANTVPIRPNRNEPRSIRRMLRRYPCLVTPRAKWRNSRAS